MSSQKPRQTTRMLSLSLFSEIGFLEMAKKSYDEGDLQKAVEWFFKFTKLNAFRQMNGTQKSKILGAFFIDLLSEGHFDLIDEVLSRMKLEDRTMHTQIGTVFVMANNYFRRATADKESKLIDRKEVISAIKRIRPTYPLPES